MLKTDWCPSVFNKIFKNRAISINNKYIDFEFNLNRSYKFILTLKDNSKHLMGILILLLFNKTKNVLYNNKYIN